jgi:hypothetical protein
MSSLLHISNKALRALGVKEIKSLTQQGKPAARCNAAVVSIVKEVIRVHPFSFSTEWKRLNRSAEAPPFGYAYAYLLPSNYQKLFDARESPDLRVPKIEYEQVRGNIIYTDASICYARYGVYNEGDLAKAPPDAIKTMAYALAAEISVPLAKTNKLDKMEALYRYYLDRAQLADASGVEERKIDENRENSILKAREYPSSINNDDWNL